MKLKTLNYILSPLVSLLLLSGCGSSSSSENQPSLEDEPNSRLSDKEEQVAIYIPHEALESQSPLSKANTTTPSFNKSFKLIKENAERENLDGQWIIYDKNPAGAGISIEYDDKKESRVIALNGDGLQNGYVLGYWAKPGSWDDKNNKIIQWSMSYSEDYYVYVRVSTQEGYRYLYYTPSDNNYGIAENYDAPHYIHHGLGSNSTDGSWKTFTRDLEADLKEFDPTNTLISVDGFFVRGSGRIDDVALLSEDETTPPTPPSVEEEIAKWLTSFNSRATVNKIVMSDNKQRAILYSDWHENGGEYLHLLDISDLNNIKELTRIFDYRTNSTEQVIIKDNDAIIFVRTHGVLIYDFDTGELLSSYNTSSGVLDENIYLLIEENFMVFSYLDKFDKHQLVKLDFTDRSNLIITTLYEGDSKTTYILSDDKSKIIIKDKDDNVIQEIEINSVPLSLEKSVQNWLYSNRLGGSIEEISQDKSRVIITGYKLTQYDTEEPNTYTTLILDISNLEDIQQLVRKDFYRYDFPIEYKIEDNDYIMVARLGDLLIYDYTTGDLLSQTVLSKSTGIKEVTYLLFKDNKIIYIDYDELKVIDYTNRSNPIIQTLDNNPDYTYELSTDKTKVLVKDLDGNVVQEISIESL